MTRQYDPIALEILKMARELVLNEYTDRRAQDHNKWLADFETVWKNTRVRLPYPDIPPYPTENEIVKRAQVLMDFIHDNYSEEQEKNQNIEETDITPDTVQDTVDDIKDVMYDADKEDAEFQETVAEVVEQALAESNKQVVPENPVTKEKPVEKTLNSFFRKLTS